MRVLLQKQPQEVLSCADYYARKQYYKALDKVKKLKGDIKRMKGFDGLYRYKNDYCRIHFTVDKRGNIVVSAMRNKAHYHDFLQEDLP